MKLSFGKVAVLYGGNSSEREVSLMSGVNIFNALKRKGLDVYLFDTARNSLSDFIAEKFDVVFIALHGKFGEDGVFQGILDLLKIPYTGSSHISSSIAINKIITKKLWKYEGLPTPNFIVINEEKDFKVAYDCLGLPLIIKPESEGSTFGITKVNSYSDMSSAYAKARSFSNNVFAEQFIPGRELTVSILEKDQDIHVLPIIEILAPDNNYDYHNKYFSEETKYLCPANLLKDVTDEIIDISKRAYNTVKCSGWARIDLILDSRNKPWLLEINTCPGMTNHSLFPISAKAFGIDYDELCLCILSGAF